MKKIINIVCLYIVFILISLIYGINVEAKYVIEEEYEIINIKSADNSSPYINGKNNYEEDEIFNNDVTIDYSDNLKVKYAKYWYNSLLKEFNDEGIDFYSGLTFTLEGWYKIEVSDMYNNITTYIFCIDKEFNEIELSCTDITDTGGTLVINATDLITGIQTLELFINDELYCVFINEEEFITSETEEVFVDIDELPFYEEAYVIATDFYGNYKISDAIIPNKSRIYDLQDLVKFENVVNDGISTFADETVYLLNDIDLSSVCGESVGSWNPIGEYSNSFAGIFEGGNHNILNMYIKNIGSESGFFGVIRNAVVQNLNVYGKIIANSSKAAGIVGYLYSGSVINCTSSVEISSTSGKCAGITGINRGTISYCSNLGNISGTESVAGIAGYNSVGCVEYCYNSGNITATGNYTGGIIGYTSNSTIREEEISYCYNTGSITGIESVGGICGAAWDNDGESIIIEYVYNVGTVSVTTSTYLVGGILGGTYYDCFNFTIKENANVLRYGYNIGVISSNGSKFNQISSGYINCTKMYYITGRTNTSGYGTAKSSTLFKTGLSDTASVLYLLNESKSGVWTIDSNYNSRKCNFCLAVKLKNMYC